MKKAIMGVLPQPGPTLPYSEFNGLKISPNFVFKSHIVVVIALLIIFLGFKS